MFGWAQGVLRLALHVPVMCVSRGSRLSPLHILAPTLTGQGVRESDEGGAALGGRPLAGIRLHHRHILPALVCHLLACLRVALGRVGSIYEVRAAAAQLHAAHTAPPCRLDAGLRAGRRSHQNVFWGHSFQHIYGRQPGAEGGCSGQARSRGQADASA